MKRFMPFGFLLLGASSVSAVSTTVIIEGVNRAGTPVIGAVSAHVCLPPGQILMLRAEVTGFAMGGPGRQNGFAREFLGGMANFNGDGGKLGADSKRFLWNFVSMGRFNAAESWTEETASPSKVFTKGTRKGEVWVKMPREVPPGDSGRIQLGVHYTAAMNAVIKLDPSGQACAWTSREYYLGCWLPYSVNSAFANSAAHCPIPPEDLTKVSKYLPK